MGQMHYRNPVNAAPLRDEADYVRALDEIEDLFLCESGTPDARRFDELVELIDDYEARRQVRLFATGSRDARATPRT